VTPRRVGWLGGSFDPVHDGHLAIARAAIEAHDLERVLLVPARLPPHKLDKRLALPEQRLELLQLATADDALMEPCDVELHRDGPSYSLDTALALRELLGPDVELYYIIGADTLADLPNWHRIRELLTLVTFCPVARDGNDLDVACLAELADAPTVQRVAAHRVSMAPHPASSTAIREQLAAEQDAEHLAPAVSARIAELGLYKLGGASSGDASSTGNS
jgi:nicotinate-nucleotide adenylyltransferase